MKMHISDDVASLQGDWTYAGVTQDAIESLAVALQQIEHGSRGRISIDCREMSAVDIFGQQMLSVWMQCANLRGVESELVNPPSKLLHAFESLGLAYRTTPLDTPGINHRSSHNNKEI